MPAGINFREGMAGFDFTDGDPFLLHTVTGKHMNPLNFKMTERQAELRRRLYGNECTNIYGSTEVSCLKDSNAEQFSPAVDGKVAHWVKDYK